MMTELILIVTILVLFLSYNHTEAALQIGFYRDKCPSAETIIRNEVAKAFVDNKGIAPGLVRLHFHDCFVGGCDGSILIDSTSTNQAEKDGPPNGITLRGLEVIDNAKAKLEAICKGTVSCADILAYAAGRRDGRISKASETSDIPAPFLELGEITQSFANKNLSQHDMVALLGAHTIGRSHCSSFADRLYNFSSTGRQDPSLNSPFAQLLKQQCPINSQGDVSQTDVVFMNQSPFTMDPSYYGNLFQHDGLFTSDQTLFDSQETTRQVAFYATQGLAWQADFVQAMIKMSQIQVLTGTEGEIHSNCRKIN